MDIKNSFMWLTVVKKTKFLRYELFWLWPFFDLFSDLMDQKIAGAKKVVFMPVNQVKKYLMFVHNSAVYSHFLSELQIAPIVLILEINVPNVVQELLRTYILLI